MTALHPVVERAITFKAWRNTRPIEGVSELTDCICIEEAAQLLAPRCGKGAALVILMTDAGRNRKTLGIYKVRESTRRYSWRPSSNGGRPVKVGELEPLLLHAEDVHAYAPVEPFRVTRDTTVAEIVGNDVGLIEGRVL